MATNSWQKQAYCKGCKLKTLHMKLFTKRETSLALHLFLCFITAGIWVPIFILILVLGSICNTLGGLGARWHCQKCGKKK
jgi:hypothetical protein